MTLNTHPKHLPAVERPAVTVEALVELAGAQIPSEITISAIAKHMNLTQGLVMQSLLAGDVERIRHVAPRVFAIHRRGIGSAR